GARRGAGARAPDVPAPGLHAEPRGLCARSPDVCLAPCERGARLAHRRTGAGAAALHRPLRNGLTPQLGMRFALQAWMETAMQDKEFRWDEPTREEINRTRGPLVLKFGTAW